MGLTSYFPPVRLVWINKEKYPPYRTALRAVFSCYNLVKLKISFPSRRLFSLYATVKNTVDVTQENRESWSGQNRKKAQSYEDLSHQ